MAITYEPIATQTLGSATATVTFSSISGTYTDLVLVWTGINSTDAGVNYSFNSNTTASDYSFTRLYGDGSSATSDRATSARNFNGISGSTQSMNIAHIQNYSNTTTFKTTLIRNNYGPIVLSCVGLWRKTDAISSIALSATGGSFNTGSTFTLYGIKSA